MYGLLQNSNLSSLISKLDPEHTAIRQAGRKKNPIANIR